MKTDEQDDLWRLLGRAKEPSVSPFFSRNVLRAIREEKQETVSLLARLFASSRHWRWALLSASACVLLVVSGLALRHASQPPLTQADQVTVLARQVSTSPDYQVINHLDELLASEETSVWLDK
ncbi:MAG TPA: hypothetical protein VGM54_18720 [Chthoniobacter sp.]|jgi:hypothetical protein